MQRSNASRRILQLVSDRRAGSQRPAKCARWQPASVMKKCHQHQDANLGEVQLGNLLAEIFTPDQCAQTLPQIRQRRTVAREVSGRGKVSARVAAD